MPDYTTTSDEVINQRTKYRPFILLHLGLARKADEQAQEANNAWREQNQIFNHWYRRQYPDNVDAKGNPIDQLHYVNTKSPNLILKDKLDTWSFFEREAKRHNDAIQRERVIMELEREGVI